MKGYEIIAAQASQQNQKVALPAFLFTVAILLLLVVFWR